MIPEVELWPPLAFAHTYLRTHTHMHVDTHKHVQAHIQQIRKKTSRPFQ